MGELFTVAFRNIFRNTRRSLLTVFICLLSVFMLILSSSYLGGMFENILQEGIKFSGHLRVTAQDYELKEKMMSLTANLDDYEQLREEILEAEPLVDKVVGRIKFGGLVYKGDENTDALGYGIEEADLEVLDFKQIVYSRSRTHGSVLNPKTNDEILVGRELAENLGLKIDDEVTVLTRTLYNSTWAMNFKVVGLFDMQNGRLNKGFYISLPAAQELLDMYGRVTELLVFGRSHTVANVDTETILKGIKNLPLMENREIKPWNEVGLNPLFAGVASLVAGIIQVIIMILAGLGISNTMLMAVFERKNEIGLLKSMGMRVSEIISLFTIEGFVLGLLGTVMGLVLGGTGAYLLSIKGVNLGGMVDGMPVLIGNVIYGVFNSKLFMKGIVLGLGTAFLASLLPVIGGSRLKPAEALKNTD